MSVLRNVAQRNYCGRQSVSFSVFATFSHQIYKTIVLLARSKDDGSAAEQEILRGDGLVGVLDRGCGVVKVEARRCDEPAGLALA